MQQAKGNCDLTSVQETKHHTRDKNEHNRIPSTSNILWVGPFLLLLQIIKLWFVPYYFGSSEYVAIELANERLSCGASKSIFSCEFSVLSPWASNITFSPSSFVKSSADMSMIYTSPFCSSSSTKPPSSNYSSEGISAIQVLNYASSGQLNCRIWSCFFNI